MSLRSCFSGRPKHPLLLKIPLDHLPFFIPQVARVSHLAFIDLKAARGEIDQRLDELERIAREGGYALGIGSPYPVTIERVMVWAQELERKGIALAPVSALVDKQPD